MRHRSANHSTDFVPYFPSPSRLIECCRLFALFVFTKDISWILWFNQLRVDFHRNEILLLCANVEWNEMNSSEMNSQWKSTTVIKFNFIVVLLSSSQKVTRTRVKKNSISKANDIQNEKRDMHCLGNTGCEHNAKALALIQYLFEQFAVDLKAQWIA